jgi:hypothetical protein
VVRNAGTKSTIRDKKKEVSLAREPGSGIPMDKDHLPLLEDQNPQQRSEMFTGTGRAKFSLTEVIKKISSASGCEADIRLTFIHRLKHNRKSV